jgi:hypothetical protein
MHHRRHTAVPILIGLGVRIDYSLFIARTGTGVRRGLSVEEAVTGAAGTSAVLLAGYRVHRPARHPHRWVLTVSGICPLAAIRTGPETTSLTTECDRRWSYGRA